MADARKLTLYHAARTRSSGVLCLLEELGATYELEVLNLKSGEQRAPAYLAVNPMGKVPAITHGTTLVTEQVAINIYLTDVFPEKRLAPAPQDPLRGDYLRWMAFYAAAFEPAVIDRALQREPAPQAMCPYGDYDSMLKVVTDRLKAADYMLGNGFTAADALWGPALGWTTGFGLVPRTAEIAAYIERCAARPAFARVEEIDARITAAQEAAAS